MASDSAYQISAYECKYCEKTFDDDSHSMGTCYTTTGVGGTTIARIICDSCSEKKHCKVCRKVFTYEKWSERKCGDCMDIAAKFWAKTLPGVDVPGFAIDIDLETITSKYCTDDGKPVAIKTDSRVWIPDGSAVCTPEEDRKTLRFPVRTGLDAMFFDDFEMSCRFKELIKRDEERPLPGCKCQKPWSNGCRRVYKIHSCKLVQFVTPKQQILQFKEKLVD